MSHHAIYLLIAAGLLSFTACDDDDDPITIDPVTFTVTIENVSQPNTLTTDRAMGTVPLSPVAFALFTGDNPMFEVGGMANLGIERIAEDGFADEMTGILNAATNVKASGVATSPGGPDNGPAIFAGEGISFTFEARPGDVMQFATMWVQSNDWFFALGDGGVELFNGNVPISGDLTSEVAVYDAGTEEDTAPGTGPDQKPAQDAMATDVGPAESVAIQNARSRHPGFTIPANADIIRVTVSNQ